MTPDTRTHAHTDTRTELTLDVGPVAHGGHCVARHEGRVIFVRHGIPGEKVRVRLTDDGPAAKFWRADVVEVLEPSPDRVPHFWDLADSARSWSHRHPPVGGAELGHISLARQRSLKAEVLAEQLKRLAGVELAPAGQLTVEAVGTAAGEPAASGLGWRTRAGFAVTAAGKLGMHAHRSDAILPVRDMPLAVDGINALRLWDIDLQGIDRVEVAAPANGSRPLVLLVPAPGTRSKRLSGILAQLPDDVSVASLDPATGEVLQLRGRTYVQESAAGHEYRVTGDGFWQIHRDAPETLVGAVTGFLHDGGYLAPGSVVADLYAGAGLFTAPLADAVGVTGSVLSVEGAPGNQPRCTQEPARRRPGRDRPGPCGARAAAETPQLRRPDPGPATRRCRQGGSQTVDGRRSPGRRLRLLRSGLIRPRPGLLPAGRLGPGRAACLRPVPAYPPHGDCGVADSSTVMPLGWA